MALGVGDFKIFDGCRPSKTFNNGSWVLHPRYELKLARLPTVGMYVIFPVMVSFIA